MTPILPSNPLTITPVKRPVTREDAIVKYARMSATSNTFFEINEDLKFLRALDTYSRATDKHREETKQYLREVRLNLTRTVMRVSIPVANYLSESEKSAAAVFMTENGGAFARHIGAAWLNGDPSNKARVFTAFSDLFVSYHAIVTGG